jgi:zinc transport system ATP-binding protein
LEDKPEAREVISIRNLWAGYDREQVLEDINLVVYEGDFIGLIGPNGGGKTTLIRVLLGLLEPTQGEVRIMGRPVQAGRSEVGYVPQLVEFDRDFPVSIWDVACMGRLGQRRLLQRYSPEDEERVSEALRQVEMFDLRQQPIGELSSGQRQRVYLARALAAQPKILLLDEPTSSIDPQVTSSIYELLRRLNEHVTILLISHDMKAVSSYVKTIGCLNRRLFYHSRREITAEMLELAYQCPVDLIAHGVPHRILAEHTHAAQQEEE